MNGVQIKIALATGFFFELGTYTFFLKSGKKRKDEYQIDCWMQLVGDTYHFPGAHVAHDFLSMMPYEAIEFVCRATKKSYEDKAEPLPDKG